MDIKVLGSGCSKCISTIGIIERAAREARYAAFAGQLGEGELLLTGQHRDDQAETLLLRLLQGAA